MPLPNVLLEDEQRRIRAKDRLYVIFQAGGWLSFLGLETFLLLAFPTKEAGRAADTVYSFSIVIFVICLGWLITHFARLPVAHWGWKNLGWRGLAPRILGISFVQSVIWSAVGYGYPYLVLQLPWSGKVSCWLAFVFSVMNGTFMLTGWWCIYFFYHLFDRYNRLQIEQLSLATHVKEAELRALKSQVNPHFIFNSLNSLRALIDEDPSRARQAVTQLANLLRYSLQSGQQETVPFEDELRVVNDYLALEQVRHEERLRLRLDVAPETLQLPIPPMLLQTLVENAVKYGISMSPEGGEIAILARREHGALRLQVTNPGALDGGAEQLARASASTGVGLANAANRLRLLFGDRAQLVLRPDKPGLVVAEAVIPLTHSHA
ncbi:MAG: histidine kinase [Verrucomicrobia bacterium]|nr:histidine kinase [Verrucomicrobiota bacterium]